MTIARAEHLRETDRGWGRCRAWWPCLGAAVATVASKATVVRIISTTGLIFAPDDVQTRRGLQRPDCVAVCAVLCEPVSASLPLLFPCYPHFSGIKSQFWGLRRLAGFEFISVFADSL